MPTARVFGGLLAAVRLARFASEAGPADEDAHDEDERGTAPPRSATIDLSDETPAHGTPPGLRPGRPDRFLRWRKLSFRARVPGGRRSLPDAAARAPERRH